MPQTIMSRRALDDMRALAQSDARRVIVGLEELRRDAANVDVRALVGLTPWLRMRWGNVRVLLRRLPHDHPSGHGGAWLVARVVHRRDLDRAARSLRNV